jgi:hypothetical protein
MPRRSRHGAGSQTLSRVGAFNLPYAETHTIVLSHTLADNAPAASLSRALGAGDPARALFALASRLGTARAEGHKHAEERHRARLRHRAEEPYWNPRPIGRAAVRALIARAWAGEPPVVDI